MCEALDMALLSCGGEDEMNHLLEEHQEHQEKGENRYKSKRRDKQLTQQSWNGTLGENSTSKDAIDMITFDLALTTALISKGTCFHGARP